MRGGENGEGVGPWSAIATATTTAAPNAPPLFSSAATFSVAENTVTVGTVAATDGDAGDEITGYEIDAVAAEIGDGALFAIADGALFAIDAGHGRPDLQERAELRSPGRCRHRQRIYRGG